MSATRSTAALAAVLIHAALAAAADCNGNGIDDALDLRPRGFGFPTVVGFPAPDARAVAVADANLDGMPDVLAASGAPSGFHVLLQSGDAELRLSRTVPAGAGFATFAAADLDGDAIADAVVGTSRPPSVLTFHGDGAGDFIPPRSRALAAEPRSLLPIDVDGDGGLDLAMVLRDALSIVTLVREKTGEWRSVEHPVDGSPVAIASVDHDGDGDVDLVAAVPFEVLLLDNVGGGVFVELAGFPVGSNPIFLAGGDQDGDGDDDIVSANLLPESLPNNLSLLRNLGNGSFAPALNFGVIDPPSALLSTDMDGDRDLDLLVASDTGGALEVFLNGGNGRFDQAGESALDSPMSIAAADMDADGDSDVLVADYGTDSVRVLRNGGSGNLSELLRLGAGSRPRVIDTGAVLYSVFAADLDGNDTSDLVATSAGGLQVLRNDGEGQFEAPRGIPVPGSSYTAGAAGDLDGDGDLDLAVTLMKEGTLVVVENERPGELGLPGVPVPAGAKPAGIALEDLDGDGDADAAVVSYDPPGATILRNDGTGSFAVDGSYPVGGPGVGTSIAVEDVDGDSDADLALASSSSIFLLLNDGSGRFTRGDVLVGVGLPSRVAPGDVDGDGDVDLVASDRIFGDVVLFLNEGGVGFGDPVRFAAGRQPAYVGLADVDSDGALDLITANHQGGDVSVLINSGSGAFMRASSYVTGGVAPTSVVAVDLDGDLDLDLVTANSNSGDLSILENHALPPLSRDLDGNGIPDECLVSRFRRGDGNGDGKNDITDPILMLEHLFLGGAAPACAEAADANNDGTIELTDAITLLEFLFLHGPPPPAPGPAPGPCGPDTDPPGSPGDLGCDRYEGC